MSFKREHQASLFRGSAYKKMKENLQENELILHLDYSERYSNTQQDEIQIAYFDNSIFSIFTACGYILDHRKEFCKCSVAAASKCSDNSRIAALTCLDMVLKVIKKNS